MSCTVYTFVGISLITNYNKYCAKISGVGWESQEDLAYELEKLNELKINDDDSKTLKRITPKIREILKTWITNVEASEDGKYSYCNDGETLNQFASAEITSLLQFAKKKKQDLDVVFLASDTLASHIIAEILVEIINGISNDVWRKYGLNDLKINVYYNRENNYIKGLQIDNYELFSKEGLRNFLQFYSNTIGEHPYNVYFNITSGYKAFIPFVTIMAQVYQFDCFYLFENQGAIIEIPRLPLNFDDSVIENNFEYFYRIEIEQHEDGLEISEIEKASFYNDPVTKNLLEEFDGKVMLSGLGQILWNKWKEKYVLFYSPDDVFRDICSKEKIRSILETYDPATQAWDEFVKPEGKNKQVFKRSNTTERIFYFKHKRKYAYIYKVFSQGEHDQEYERYNQKIVFNEKFQQEIINKSKLQKLRKKEEN